MEKPDYITPVDWLLLQDIYKDREDYLKEMLQKKYPIQYLIGFVDFFDSRIEVNESVLIPRFETEQLVQKTFGYIADLKIEKPTILDIGTGSGCIAIAFSRYLPKSKVTALDKSKKALEVAKKNAVFLKQDIKFREKDVFDLAEIPYYDIVVCNPPYVKVYEPVDAETKYEPPEALFADNHGLEFYEHIIPRVNKETKLIALEIGATMGKEIMEIAKKAFPKARVILEKDYNNRDRFVFILK